MKGRDSNQRCFALTGDNSSLVRSEQDFSLTPGGPLALPALGEVPWCRLVSLLSTRAPVLLSSGCAEPKIVYGPVGIEKNREHSRGLLYERSPLLLSGSFERPPMFLSRVYVRSLGQSASRFSQSTGCATPRLSARAGRGVGASSMISLGSSVGDNTAGGQLSVATR